MIWDRLSGGVLLLLGLTAVGVAWNFYVPYQYEPLGPKAMPFFVGGLLIFSGGRLVLSPRSDVMHAVVVQPAGSWWRGLLLLTLLLGYGFSYELLGFVVSSFLLSVALAWMCGARKVWCFAVVAGLTLVSQLVLVQGLGLQLPAGLLAGWI